MDITKLIQKTVEETVDKSKQGDDVWEEYPVSPVVFFKDWLKPELSEPQLDVFNNLFKGKEWNKDYLEYLLFWGEGGGKDFTCARILIYTAYFLMCLRSPQRWLNFTENEPIDLVNISVSGIHSKNVFFNRFTTALKAVINPKTNKNWFAEKGMDLRDMKDIQMSKVNFKKNITAHSLNSVKYSGEGKNILLAIFDEIAEFKPHKAKEIYDNLWFTAETRWGSRDGSSFRIILISYLRHEHDYMNYRWEQSKTEQKIYRSKKATWEVRPDKTREDYNEAFKKNPEEAARRLQNILMKGAGNSFFVYREKIKEAINVNRISPFIGNPLKTDDLNDLTLASWFQPFKTQEICELELKSNISEIEKKLLTSLKSQHSDALYFAHIDLAKGKDTGDAVGFGFGHLFKKNPDLDDAPLHIYIDILMQLRAVEGEIDFERIRDFLFKLNDLGFPFGRVTLDGYQCLTGDTKIKLINGTSIEIKDLVGKNPWVYSYNGEEIIPTRAKNIRKTGKKSPVYEVTLDNGEKIKATGEHPFMLRNGEYKNCKNLKKNDSLMPLYLKISKNKGIKGYRLVYQPAKKGKWVYEHRHFMKYYNTNNYNKYYRNGFVIHHKNFNKLDNTKENLAWMDKIKHIKYHQKLVAKFNLGTKRTSQQRKNISLAHIGIENKSKGKTYKEIYGIKKANDILRRISLNGKGVKRFYVRTEKQLKESSERMKKRWKNKQFREIVTDKISNTVTKLWENDIYINRRDTSSYGIDNFNTRLDVTIEKVQKLIKLKLSQKEIAQKLNCSQALIRRRKRFGNLVLNHKVVSVKFFGYEDVYDMEIPKYHNFALDAGVFVHNSVDFEQLLNKKGIKCEQLSVDKTDEAYQTLKERIYNKTVDYYAYPVFIRECEELIKVDNKVDHPEISLRRSIEEGNDRGSKDVGDCGAGIVKSALDYEREIDSDWVGTSF